MLPGPGLYSTRRLTMQRIFGTGTCFAPIIPDDVAPKHWLPCIYAAIDNPCKVFSPTCSDIMAYLRNNHGQFCELLYAVLDDVSTKNFYRGIQCSSLPTVDDLFDIDCAYCIAIPLMGSIKRMNLSNLQLDTYDSDVVEYALDTSMCFHHANQLEYADLSDNYREFSALTGLIQMKVLNLSHSGISIINSPYMNDQWLLQLPSLQILDMSGYDMSVYNSLVRLKSNGNIRFLSFAYNSIPEIPYGMFSHLLTLQELDLSHNHIQSF